MPRTAVFVTCTPKGPVKEHPKGVVVLQTGPNGTVLTNQNDPDEAAKVLAQAQKLIAGDNSPEDSTKMKPNQPFLRQSLGVASPADKKQMTKGVTIGKKLWEWHAEGRFKGNPLDLDKGMFHDRAHSHYLKVPEGFPERSLFEGSIFCVAMGISNTHFMELCDDTLTDLEVRTLVHHIETNVKAKVWSLEMQYNVHNGKKKDTNGHGISLYGRRFNKLKKAMEAMLGETGATQKLKEHAGIKFSGGTQTLLNFGAQKGKKGLKK